MTYKINAYIWHNILKKYFLCENIFVIDVKHVKTWISSVACLTFHWFVLPFHQSFCLCTLDILQILQHAGWRLLIAFLGQRSAFSPISSKWFLLLAQQPPCNQRDVFPDINKENFKVTILQWKLIWICDKIDGYWNLTDSTYSQIS